MHIARSKKEGAPTGTPPLILPKKTSTPFPVLLARKSALCFHYSRAIFDFFQGTLVGPIGKQCYTVLSPEMAHHAQWHI